MKEYIKKFDSAAAVHNYAIADIPFTTSVATDPIQNLVCNETGKKLVNISGIIQIQSNGPEMVDLGLSVKWAKYNIGVNSEDLSTADKWYGNYYACAGTQTQESYDGDNCPYCTLWDDREATYKFTKYVPTNMEDFWGGTGFPDNKLVLDPIDDVATTIYGSDYRMPTQAEIEELIALSNQWITNYNNVSGLNGRVFTGTNGNTLFIPAAGYFDGASLYDDSSDCYLRSSSIDNPLIPRSLHFNSDEIFDDYPNRYYGFPVRCVSNV